MIVYLLYAPLWYSSAAYVASRIQQALESAPIPVRAFVLDLNGVSDIDYTGARVLGDLAIDLRHRGVSISVAGRRIWCTTISSTAVCSTPSAPSGFSPPSKTPLPPCRTTMIGGGRVPRRLRSSDRLNAPERRYVVDAGVPRGPPRPSNCRTLRSTVLTGTAKQLAPFFFFSLVAGDEGIGSAGQRATSVTPRSALGERHTLSLRC